MRAPDPPDFDLYETLEVSPHASSEMIDAAWKVMLRRYHPDIGGRGSADAAAKRINVAHDWLSDPVLRSRYDATRPDLAIRRGAPAKGPSFRPPSFRTAAPGGPAGGARPSVHQARPVSAAAARPGTGPSPVAPPPPSANATPAPSGMPARAVRQRRSVPTSVAFLVAILIGMLAGLLYLAPIVFSPKPSASPGPSVTAPPSRTPRVTRTADGHLLIAVAIRPLSAA